MDIGTFPTVLRNDWPSIVGGTRWSHRRSILTVDDRNPPPSPNGTYLKPGGSHRRDIETRFRDRWLPLLRALNRRYACLGVAGRQQPAAAQDVHFCVAGDVGAPQVSAQPCALILESAE